MLGLATHDGIGTVMVGKDGKSFYMDVATSKSNNPSWTECRAPTQNDFITVDSGSTCFMALTENEWYTSSLSGGILSWTKMGSRTVSQDVCGPFVGICHVDGDIFMAVTSKGYLFRLENTSESNVGNLRLGEMCANGMVKGIKSLRQHHVHDEKMFFCYGYPGSDSVNVLRVRFDGIGLNSIPDLQSTIAIKEGGQPIEINELSFLLKDAVYVVGQNGKFGLVRDNLFYTDGGSREFISSSTLSSPIPNNFMSVYFHNPGWTYSDYTGYAVCEGGRIFLVTRQFDMMNPGVYIESTTEVAANVYSENFNIVRRFVPLSAVGNYHYFAAGNNGLSMLIVDHDEFLSQKKLSSSDSPFFGSNINTICAYSDSRFFAGGQNGILYRGDKQTDGSFLWTRCRIDSLGTGEIYAIHCTGDYLYVIYASGAGKIKIMKLDSDGNYQSVSSEVTANYKNSASYTEAYSQLYMGTEAGTYLLKGNALNLDKYGPRPAMNYAALEAKSSQDMYMAEVSGADSKVYSSVNGGLGFTTQLLKTYTDTIVDCMLLVGDDLYVGGKDSATDKAFLAKYDGTNFTKLAAGPNGIQLRRMWSYGKYIYALGDANDGYVYNYNIETEVWTSELVNSVELYGLDGSGDGGFLIAGGEGGRAFRTKIDSCDGDDPGCKTSTEVLPATGEDADLVASNNPVKRTSAELEKQFKTDPSFKPLGNVEAFISKTTLVAGSVHCFKFNVTPNTTVPVNDCHLYKLISSSSSSTDYTRLNGIPAQTDYAHGTYWLTDANGRVRVSGEQLQAGNIYTVFFVIEDNGSVYDADPVLGTIADPTVFGYSGSGGGGCVLDPGQDGCTELTWMLFGVVLAACFVRGLYYSLKRD
ncbi:hypothetical protein D0S45_06205 [Marinifilum sp. JC120]|nr:hypothetical protein D0S45_06205 [Marinifilum sp. JC120]